MDVTPPLQSTLPTDRLLGRAAELRAMALTGTSQQANELNRLADRFSRLAAERRAHAAQAIQAANWWFQHYRRTGDQRALRCASVCRDMAVERQRTVRRTPTASGLHERPESVAGLVRAAAGR